MKSLQIIRELVNLDLDLNQDIIVNFNGNDYTVEVGGKRIGGMYDGCIELELKALPPDPLHLAKEVDMDSPFVGG